jgi:hypothetical protein
MGDRKELEWGIIRLCGNRVDLFMVGNCARM